MARALQSSRGENVDHFVGNHRFGDDLPDGVVELLIALALAGFVLGEHCRHRLKEPHVIADARSAAGCGTARANPNFSKHAQKKDTMFRRAVVRPNTMSLWQNALKTDSPLFVRMTEFTVAQKHQSDSDFRNRAKSF